MHRAVSLLHRVYVSNKEISVLPVYMQSDKIVREIAKSMTLAYFLAMGTSGFGMKFLWPDFLSVIIRYQSVSLSCLSSTG